jgi:hypothetical protein
MREDFRFRFVSVPFPEALQALIVPLQDESGPVAFPFARVHVVDP